ncbi:hypothetical protein [Desulfosporosinus sp. BG]|uniref:hypothetical protein n=1 Tax=Desulfosporosinus sp. BG TaxID=1633135 RepID=UPI000856830B|nr:hypothetical protein [Desulfosporosinus sp. BG]ODA40431.1 hypothetical protein DSBG_2748 [Desulfosporosinus sp. BG]
MVAKRNKVSKQVTAQPSTHTNKNSPTSNSTGQARDAIIPTKDKSPDDLEIFD